ncbi:hypothetical protein [Lysobacter sp. Root494]|uniref:hypothetical protein n=1 Tax=Lysobacter sp. Root494 TaxID=1736549 RepID=UPI000AB138B7|nr:hypothetical protein [Lysobacter sp. Root494]
MILNSMLSSSPVFLFAMSSLLLALYGMVRLAKACFQYGQRAFSHSRRASAHS